jgi:flavin-dependent dehydrogenase
LFEVLGVRDAMDSGPFLRSTGNTVWWGRGETRVESFPPGAHGWQVTADGLQDVVRAAAAQAGVRLEDRRATAADVRADGPLLLDCTGRAGLISRCWQLRVHEEGPRTVAIIGRWRLGAAFDVPDPTHTLIESYDDGWAWSVPLTARERSVAVMVDPERSNLARDQPPRQVYESELAKTRRLRVLLEDAVLIEGPRGWDASMYSSRAYAGENWLLVGDAASFIDPLSSAGVKKALASGWLAAIVAHTSLVRPSMRATALAFYEQRESEMYEAFRDLTRKYLSAAAVGHDHPFWSDRRADPFEDAERPLVDRALQQLRATDRLALTRADSLDVREMPAVAGREIVLERRIVSGEDPAGTRYVADVDMLTLLDVAASRETVPELFEAYHARAAPIGLPQFLTALATAVARGWVVVGHGGTKN